MGIMLYVLLISFITYVLFRTDKMRAKKRQYDKRISEKTLLFFCLMGGAFAGMIAMYQFKHKTKKTKFVFGVPLLLIFHVCLYIYSNR